MYNLYFIDIKIQIERVQAFLGYKWRKWGGWFWLTILGLFSMLSVLYRPEMWKREEEMCQWASKWQWGKGWETLRSSKSGGEPRSEDKEIKNPHVWEGVCGTWKQREEAIVIGQPVHNILHTKSIHFLYLLAPNGGICWPYAASFQSLNFASIPACDQEVGIYRSSIN